MQENAMAKTLILSIMAVGLVVTESNELMTSPMRNTKDGRPRPVSTAAIHPKYISVLSDFEANEYSFE
jgi:hypothetical protein